MLKSKPALALMYGDVEDLSKRTFTNISGFQYALWALDWHMWTMILKYLPAPAAKNQAEGVETESWVNSYGVHAQHLLDNLAKALQAAINLYHASKWAEGNTVWVQQVGRAQRLLPVHVINEYCHPSRKFYPLPNFKDCSVLPRSRNFLKDPLSCMANDGIGSVCLYQSYYDAGVADISSLCFAAAA